MGYCERIGKHVFFELNNLAFIYYKCLSTLVTIASAQPALEIVSGLPTGTSEPGSHSNGDAGTRWALAMNVIL
jgi:hypothetical protein